LIFASKLAPVTHATCHNRCIAKDEIMEAAVIASVILASQDVVLIFILVSKGVE